MATHGTPEGATSTLASHTPAATAVKDAPRRNPLRMPMVTGAFGKLVADRAATADTIVSAPAPLKPIDFTDDAEVAQVLDLAVRMGEVVLASGSAVTDTQTTVRFIAATYGLSACDVEVTYNSIRIYVDRGPQLPPASSMRVVQYRSLDFTRLAAVDRLTRRIRQEVVPPQEARAALNAITSAPHPYNRWTATFGWSLMAAAIATLLGGGLLVIALSFITTAAIDRTNRMLNRYGLPFFFQHMLGGVIAATPAIALSAVAEPLDISVTPTLIIAAGITVLLSGLSLVGSVQDAITGAPVTAAARMLELLMMTGAIIAGVALALRVGVMFDVTVPLDLASGPALKNLPIQVLAGAMAALAFSLACYAEKRALTAAACSGAMGAICYQLAIAAELGPIIAAGGAAVVIGMAGGLFARRALTPPLIVAIAGITPLLPGLSVYRGLYGMLNNEVSHGADQLLAAFGIGCALAGGVTLGEWFDRTVRRPPILRKFGGLRRPVVKRKRLPTVHLAKHLPAVNLAKHLPAVSLTKRRGAHGRRATPGLPAAATSGTWDLPAGFPVAGQLPQTPAAPAASIPPAPSPAARGRAPGTGFDRVARSHSLRSAPLSAAVTAARAAEPVDDPPSGSSWPETLAMPMLPAELLAVPAEPLDSGEDLAPTAAVPLVYNPEPAGAAVESSHPELGSDPE